MPAPFVADTTAPSRIVVVTAAWLVPLPAIAASASPDDVTATVPYTSSSMPAVFVPNVVMP